MRFNAKTVLLMRGTGDVHACHQLMEFDRTLLETIGGELIVLSSQAQGDAKDCEIAIRLQNNPPRE